MTPDSEVPAEEKIPMAYRGYWKMAVPAEKKLPDPYSAYVFEIEERADACQLLKDKGISRLLLAKGAQIKAEGKPFEIRFEHQQRGTLTLLLQDPEKGRIPGKLVVVERGKEVLKADIFLIAKKR